MLNVLAILPTEQQWTIQISVIIMAKKEANKLI
jgi:hypothetical protein